MIEIKDVTKAYEGIKAVDHVSVEIKESTVFGLIGTNGAGKSTILRMVAGVLKPQQGEILVDGGQVYDRLEVKKKIYFISDDPYFLQIVIPWTCRSIFAAYTRNLQWRIFTAI